MPVLDPNAAAIDVGSEHLHVSIAGDVPKVFGTFTRDLECLRAYFKEKAVRSVAMEATGVYWLYIYEALEAAGLEGVVVNGRHVPNVPGRKTDMADCQWLATLHAHGLLRGGFVPPQRSGVCKITSGCAPTISSGRPARCRRCRKRSNA